MSVHGGVRGPEDAKRVLGPLCQKYLGVISNNSHVRLETIGAHQSGAADRDIEMARMAIIGHVWVIAYRLREHGHADDADQLDGIFTLLADKDVTDPDVRNAIREELQAFMAGVGRHDG